MSKLSLCLQSADQVVPIVNDEQLPVDEDQVVCNAEEGPSAVGMKHSVQAAVSYNWYRRVSGGRVYHHQSAIKFLSDGTSYVTFTSCTHPIEKPVVRSHTYVPAHAADVMHPTVLP